MRTILFLMSAALVVSIWSATVQTQGAKPPDTVVLKGAPLGTVTLAHKTHSSREGVKCETCHHASKPEKPMKGAQQKCSDCHTKVAAAPMKTKLQAAFHDPMAKKGVCVDCHQAEVKKGNTKAPSKCADCHKKA